MSRVGQTPVDVPNGVSVELVGRQLSVKGKLGELSLTLAKLVEASLDGDKLWVKPVDDSVDARKLWGTYRSLVSNLVKGVSEGFKRELTIIGVGYRAAVQDKELVLQLGFSHEIRYPIPPGTTIECPSQTEITISGADKQQIGSVAAEIRSFRPPEPYKGKGIRYKDEIVLRKEGKKK